MNEKAISVGFVVVFSLFINFYIIYLYLSLASYLKPGAKRYFWTPAWIFNSKLVEPEGLPYRRKLIFSLLIFALVMVLWSIGFG